jgi:hypothetical protein
MDYRVVEQAERNQSNAAKMKDPSHDVARRG